MDPDITLHEMLYILEQFNSVPSKSKAYEDYAFQIVDHFENLNRWLEIGGTPPKKWLEAFQKAGSNSQS